MKSYVKLLAVISLLSLSITGLMAQERFYDEIKNVALNFAKEHKPTETLKVKDEVLDTAIGYKLHVSDIYEDKQYMIVNLNPKGWVVVSKDDIARPVLGYNLDGKIDNAENLPPAFAEWLAGLDKEIKEAKKAQISNETFKNKWNKLTKDPEVFEEDMLYAVGNPDSEEKTVGPLLGKIQWSQGRPYSNEVVKHTESGVPVGCVATAMEQIMKYHAWPKRGTGSYSYESSRYGTLSANFNTTYDWDAMPDRATSSTSEYAKSELAKISYHVGVSVNMHYAKGGSGSSSYRANNAFKRYFKYNTKGFKYKSSVSDSAWHNILKSDLDNKLPMYYRGRRSNSNSGHAFVCDGYRYKDSSKKYHFNWGWGGSYNGWFSIGALKPSYNNSNGIIFGIKPKYSPESDTTPPTIKLNGNSQVTIKAGDTYKDAGAIANDNKDGDITSKIVTRGLPIDTSKIGKHTIYYNVSDSAGNKAKTVTRIVEVISNGGNNLSAPTALSKWGETQEGVRIAFVDNTSNEDGFKAYVNLYGSSELASVVSIEDMPGTGETQYKTLTGLKCGTLYSVSVTSYNENGESKRSNVRYFRTKPCSPESDTTPPTIKLNGSQQVTIKAGDTYKDAGAIANDNKDGDITSKIVTRGLPIDTSKIGKHTIYYNVSDSAGNKAKTVTRIVEVISNGGNNLSAPTALSKWGETQEGVRIAFVDNTSNEDGFKAYVNLYGSSELASVVSIEDMPGTGETQYKTLTGLKCGTLYGVNVTAYNKRGESKRSNVRYFRTKPCRAK